ncbi:MULTISPECIES: phage tail tape measure protein [Halocynthiibacter]|uniref:Phage tail tape measure protein n=1 Tax=Halocynthiibacter halioticoli TaxID=2986804 RepID=A0AAE3J053_9RHOB|nr:MULTISPECIES: phage tail tape measure protein [Halocynthiibacter]MCV6824093.1 phage tail tape measure protein [Halocynthiibacter halioticoli]MCW4057094.1 phage tail tape measure protein [Halocynthiibacter sp. SDUM655004]MDE0589877.1 phage tail tape measure protein [Halocynthiibacter sp. C4]
MTKDVDGIGEFDDRVEALENSLSGASAMSATFEAELLRMRETLSSTGLEVSSLSSGIGRGLRRAFDGLVFDGMKLSDALNTVGRSMIDTAYAAAIKPVTNQLGGIIASTVNDAVGGVMGFQSGGAFTQGKVMPFAKGGVISGPTNFPMRGGMGLMGEAGPEAIMPLARGADGSLGVRTQGGGRPVNITMNISTPDVQGFKRSQGQIAAQLSRAVGRGQRNA